MQIVQGPQPELISAARAAGRGPFASGKICRVLALDIDGTLVNSQNELTETTRTALLRAAEAGIRLVLATGRRYSKTLPLAQPLGIECPLVTASGALIKHPRDHSTLFRAAFGTGVIEGVLSAVIGGGYSPVVYADTFHHGFDFFWDPTVPPGAYLEDVLSKNVGLGRECPGIACNPPAGVFASFAMGTRAEMLALHQTLQAQFPGQLSTHVLHSPRYAGFMCEIAPFGITKWSGILRLLADWGVSPEETCAVGDDVNDIPMLSAAGLGVAMSNALDEVKLHAHALAPGHDEDGLVDLVEWLLADRESGTCTVGQPSLK